LGVTSNGNNTLGGVLQNNFNFNNLHHDIARGNQSSTTISTEGITAWAHQRGTNAQANNARDRFSIFGYQYNDFIVVTLAGLGETGGRLGTSVSFNIAHGTSVVMVNGEPRQLILGVSESTPIRNINGTTTMPLRTLAEFMGARPHDFVFTPTAFQNMVVDTTILTLGGTEVMFYVGTPWYSVNSGPGRMMPQGTLTEIVDGRTYVSFRGFGQAFGIPVYFDAAANLAWFNHPDGLSD
jgi:hypothetical protein